VPLASLSITNFAQHQVVDCGTVDVTAFLADAAAAFGTEAVTDIAVTKVTFEGTEITEGFDAVDMSVPGYYHVTYAASYEGAVAEASFTVVAMADRNSIANGISKVNIFTDLCLAGNDAMKEGLEKNMAYLDIRNLKVEYIKEQVKKKMLVFGCNGRA
jgi:hypothetical protein